ncbi:MAG: dienelactone hydrolase family protein [bacterium]
MMIKRIVLTVLSLVMGLAAWGGGPVARSPEDIRNEPEPKAMFLRPAGLSVDQKTPLLVYLHCKTSSPIESEPVLAPLVEAWKCSLLMPCGSTKLGVKEGNIPVYDWNGNVDEETIVKDIKDAKGVNPKAVFLIGFSAGGYMAYQVALKHPELFTGVIILDADIPRKNLDEASLKAQTVKVPFYLSHGDKDSYFPASRGAQAMEYVKAAGFPATLATHEGGHALPDDLFGVIKKGVDWIGTQAKVEATKSTSIYLRPAGLDKSKKTALIVFMHGWGSSPEEVEPVFAPLVESWKCSVLYPRGGNRLGVFPNGRVAYNWNGADDVADVLKAIKGLEGVDQGRIFLTGFSSGAAMCYRVAFQEPGLFAGVIPFSGGIPGEYLAATNGSALTPKVPFYIVQGTKDGAVNASTATTAENYLAKVGVPVKVHTFDGGHFFPENVFDVMKEAIDWFGAQPRK